MIRVGGEMPSWRGLAYFEGRQIEIDSRSFQGKWLILFWYPKDFTFVCPTEINAFQRLAADFEEEGFLLIGASTDSFTSHREWFQDRNTFPNPITFPVLADSSCEISRKFRVLNESQGAAYRAVFIVDTKGIIRSISINDMEVGRNAEEVFRTAQAFSSGGLCGSNWKKGDRFADDRIASPPGLDLAADRERIQLINDSNWRNFLGRAYAVLVLTETGCPYCRKWLEELGSFLSGNAAFGDVGFGVLSLDGGDVREFKEQNEWITLIDGVPFTALFREGTPVDSFHGAGAERLSRKLTRLRDPQTDP